MTELILASGSPYRKALLARLGLDFSVMPPNIDERAEQAANGARLSERLALSKARAISGERPGAVVIGSDQVAECNGRMLGKPGNVESAIEQLEFCSGREMIFYTAVSLVQGERELLDQVPTRVRMKSLSTEQIRDYVERDQPLDCAGAMKSESLGIALTESISSDDPTALIGLPLIAVASMLDEMGLPVIAGLPA